jgi:hypothetical protein
MTKTSIDRDSGEEAKQSKKKNSFNLMANEKCRTHRMSSDGMALPFY